MARHRSREDEISRVCGRWLYWMRYRRLGMQWAQAQRKRAGLKPIRYLTWRKAWVDAWTLGFSCTYCEDDGSRCFMLHVGRKVLIVGPHFSEENEQ